LGSLRGAQPQPYAYDDGPLPIGEGQTISQPYVVALMLEKLHLTPDCRMLEVGTGSGYAAAVAALLASEVFTIERHGMLATRARACLQQLSCSNVKVRHGNGYNGWPEYAPFDAILVSAGSTEIPPALVGQLASGGRLVIPVGRARHDQRCCADTHRSGCAHGFYVRRRWWTKMRKVISRPRPTNRGRARLQASTGNRRPGA
jgi:protein-L-isoaspartate(D-aspartate) O-methyltransferase